MRLYRLLISMLLVGAMKCDISSRFLSPVILSRQQIAEINDIAEENIREEITQSLEPFVEPTPPPFPEPTTQSAANEIEIIRRNLTGVGSAAECNITAKYLWDLCRPVLLRTCKEQHRARCRTNRRRNQMFNRRLERTFPRLMPQRISFLKPKPILEWVDEQISRLNDSTSIQFSLTITNNNVTRTYTNHNAARHFSNLHREVQKGLEDLRRKYGKLFQNFPLPEYRESESFSDWILGFLGPERGEEDDDSDDADDERAVQLPEVNEDQDGEENPPPMKARSFNPSVVVPKKFRKRRRQKRHHHWPRHPMNGVGGRGHFMGRPHHRFGNHLIPAYQPDQNGVRWNVPRTQIPAHRYPSFQRPFHHRAPMRSWWWRHHYPSQPFPNFFGRESDDEDETDDIFCHKMEQDPEVCLEIADRTEKCENELERVCPEYLETRRRIKEQLSNVFSRQHQFTQTSSETDGHRSRENYRWSSEVEDHERPIVIDSITITRRGAGDAYVVARIFDKVDAKFRVPSFEFQSDSTRLGKAIGKLAIASYDSFMRQREEDA